MTNDQDHYEAFYGNKLWNLLPAVYRANRYRAVPATPTARCVSW